MYVEVKFTKFTNGDITITKVILDKKKTFWISQNQAFMYVRDISCNDLRKKLNHVLQQQNSKLWHIGAHVSIPIWMISLIIFSLIQFQSEYFEDEKVIFTETNKEAQREVISIFYTHFIHMLLCVMCCFLYK